MSESEFVKASSLADSSLSLPDDSSSSLEYWGSGRTRLGGLSPSVAGESLS